VADAALMFQTMAGPDLRDPLSLPDSGEDFLSVVQGALRLKGMRVAWSPDLGGMAPVEPEVEAICAKAAHLFEAFGCHVEEASPDVHDAHEIFAVLHANLRTASVGNYAETWAEQMDPLLVWRLEQGRQFTLADVHRAEAARMALYHRVRTFFERYDLLLLPTAGTLPYPVNGGYPAQVAGRSITTPYELLILTYLFNLTGQPAISVPAAWTPDGLPVGLQIVAPFRADALVLHAAAAFEAARPWHHRRPPLDTPPPRTTFSLNFV
jgi:amidase